MPRKHSINVSITIEDKARLLEQAGMTKCYKGDKPCLSRYLEKIARGEIKPEDRDRTIVELREEVILLRYKLLSVGAIVG